MEASRANGEWRKASTVEEDTLNKNNKICNRNIYGQVHSATGDKDLAMVKKNQDERVTSYAAVAAKKDQAKTKKTKDTTTLVTTSSEILTRLEQLGPSDSHLLNNDDLNALLIINDPLGSIP